MPPTRRKPPSDRKARVAKRVSAARQEATGKGNNDSEGDSDTSSSSSSDNENSDNEESEEEHVDDLIQLEKFKDECWLELTSSSLEEDIASLTGSGGANTTKSENIIVGFRIRPHRNTDGFDDDSAVVTRGVKLICFIIYHFLCVKWVCINMFWLIHMGI
jgi:hypothetical protein